MNFQPEQIAMKAKAKQEELEKKRNNNYEDELFKVGYLPEGEHNVRLIPSKNNELSYLGYYHRIGGDSKRRVACKRKDFNTPVDVCPICKAIEDAEAKGVSFDYKWKRTAMSKALIYLNTTNAPSDRWAPNNFYICVSNSYLAEAVTNGVGIIIEAAESAETPEEKERIYKIFNPAEENQSTFSIRHTRGNNGGTTVVPNDYKKFPGKLEIPEDKLPDLATAFVDMVNIDETKVNEAINEVAIRVQDVLNSKAQLQVGERPNSLPSQPNSVNGMNNWGTNQVNTNTAGQYAQAPNVPTPPTPPAPPSYQGQPSQSGQGSDPFGQNQWTPPTPPAPPAPGAVPPPPSVGSVPPPPTYDPNKNN